MQNKTIETQVAKENLDTLQLADHSTDYRARALCHQIPSNTDWHLLDIGSGHGEIANFLKDKYRTITLSDYSRPLLTSLKKRFSDRSDVCVAHVDVLHTHFTHRKYDIITACDIIEHIADDGTCLENAHKNLNDGGLLFISVPAFPFLYGKRDAAIGHYRRYTKKMLRKKLTEAGFHIEQEKYWNITGVLPYLFSEKVLKKELHGPARYATETITSKIINAALYRLLNIEGSISFLPVGLTLITVARK